MRQQTQSSRISLFGTTGDRVKLQLEKALLVDSRSRRHKAIWRPGAARHAAHEIASSCKTRTAQAHAGTDIFILRPDMHTRWLELGPKSSAHPCFATLPKSAQAFSSSVLHASCMPNHSQCCRDWTTACQAQAWGFGQLRILLSITCIPICVVFEWVFGSAYPFQILCTSPLCKPVWAAIRMRTAGLQGNCIRHQPKKRPKNHQKGPWRSLISYIRSLPGKDSPCIQSYT